LRLLDVDNLNTSYKDLQVLFDLSFHILKGEVVSIIGANGAGKSTLVRSISGIVKTRSGAVIFNGIDVTNRDPWHIVELGIVQIPEGRKLFGNLTVLENLELGSYLKKPKVKRKETIEFVFRFFPLLEERKHQFAGTLSGGEQQMLAIGRGLMALPELLILDEPSLGLAPRIVAEIFRTVKEMNDHGTTLLLIEQNVQKALSLSSRCYVLENGRIVLEGDQESLLSNEHVVKAYLGL